MYIHMTFKKILGGEEEADKNTQNYSEFYGVFISRLTADQAFFPGELQTRGRFGKKGPSDGVTGVPRNSPSAVWCHWSPDLCLGRSLPSPLLTHPLASESPQAGPA